MVRKTQTGLFVLTGLAYRANGNCHTRRRIRRSQHVAPPVEDAPRIHNHARRMDLAGHDALWLNLHTSLREDHAIESAGDHHPIPFDLAFDFRTLSEYHGVLGNDISLDVPVNAKRTGNGKCSFKRHTLVNESCPFFSRTI